MFKIFQDKNIIYGISKVSDGNMHFKYGDAEIVTGNRKNFLNKLGIPLDKCVGTLLIHEDGIFKASNVDTSYCATEDKEGDAFITKEKEVFLFMKVADCLPIILFDPIKNVLVAHCGWRSTDKKLAQKVIEKMTEAYGSKTSDILVAIGPGIHKESYIKDPKTKIIPDWKSFVSELENGQVKIDLVGYNKHQLIETGVPKENIEISPVDTAQDEEYFSHYRSSRNGEQEGRFCVVVGMKI